MLGNILNIGSKKGDDEKKAPPSPLNFEFIVLVIGNENKSEEKKIKASGITEEAALNTAMENARKKFTNAVEVRYTGNFKLIKEGVQTC